MAEKPLRSKLTSNGSQFRSMNYPPAQTAARLAAWFMRRTASSGVRRVAPLTAAVASDVGMVREENQDRVAIVRSCDKSGGTFVLAALADGIGGMKSGAECASLALGTFLEAVVGEAQHLTDPRDWLWQGSLRANKSVYDRYRGDGGSTLVALLLSKGHPPTWLSIGDSRVYLARDARMQQLSRDDTLEGQLGKGNGVRRSDLLQFVGIGDAIEPHVESIPWDAAGTLMLTSDGVHFIKDDYLAKVVHFAPDVGVCAKRLTELAKMIGGPDNASVAAVTLGAFSCDADPLLDGSFEVWDPFGELQVMFDSTRKPYLSSANMPALSALPKESEATPLSEAEVRQEPLAAGPVGKPAPGAAAPKDKPYRSRKRKKKPEDAIVKHSDEAAEVPQLLIEFPNKTP